MLPVEIFDKWLSFPVFRVPASNGPVWSVPTVTQLTRLCGGETTKGNPFAMHADYTTNFTM